MRIYWTCLRSVGNLQVMKLTIFVPFVGYMIIFNENILHYMELSHEIFGVPEIRSANVPAVPAKLLLLYFGLSFLAIGSALYQGFCPEEIKRYETAVDYASFMIENINGRALCRIRKIVENHNDTKSEFLKLSDDFANQLRFAEAAPDRYVDTFREIAKNNNKDILDVYFNLKNSENERAMCFSAISLLIGFSLISCQTLDVFFKVAWVAWGRFAMHGLA